jgi:hypothetical protein
MFTASRHCDKYKSNLLAQAFSPTALNVTISAQKFKGSKQNDQKHHWSKTKRVHHAVEHQEQGTKGHPDVREEGDATKDPTVELHGQQAIWFVAPTRPVSSLVFVRTAS